MSTEFTLPELGENVAAGDVLKVLVHPGDTVERDQPVLELETDKATVEVPSTVAGRVTAVNVKAGDKVKVGQVVFTVDGDSAEAPATSGAAAAAAVGTGGEAVSEVDADGEGGIGDTGLPGTSAVPTDASPEYVEEVADDDRAEAGDLPAAASSEAAPAADAGPAIVEFAMPELGENVAGGDVLHVLVKPGDRLERDQPVLEIETDKATVEVPSSVEGRVTEVRVKPGEKVAVGAVVLIVETAGTSGPRPAPVKVQQVRAASPASAPRPTPADKPGMLEHALEEARADSQPRPSRGAQVVDLASARPQGDPDAKRPPAPAAPSVRRAARELGVDIHQVKGSGPGGRISVDDVKAHVKQVMSGGGPRAAAAPAPASAPALPDLPDFSKWGAVERTPMRGVRRKTAEHMSLAWTHIPHVTQFDLADITALEELRQTFGKRVEAAGGKLTVTAVALKVVAAALRKFPQVNASVDMAAGEIVHKHYVHIGVAVDTERGLIVPVIRDVDTKSIVQISVELAQASERARTGKTPLDEMQGGTFTITNLGGIGGTHFTPIVNHPEVAILGVSRARTEPVWRDGQFVPRLMLPLSLSYDHRVVDGADGIRFLRWIVEALEQPFLLSLLG